MSTAQEVDLAALGDALSETHAGSPGVSPKKEAAKAVQPAGPEEGETAKHKPAAQTGSPPPSEHAPSQVLSEAPHHQGEDPKAAATADGKPTVNGEPELGVKPGSESEIKHESSAAPVADVDQKLGAASRSEPQSKDGTQPESDAEPSQGTKSEPHVEYKADDESNNRSLEADTAVESPVAKTQANEDSTNVAHEAAAHVPIESSDPASPGIGKSAGPAQQQESLPGDTPPVPPTLPKNHPTQSLRPGENPDDAVSFLSSMFPDLPRETVQDVYSAVGSPDRAVQVLLSFSSTETASAPALPGHHPQTLGGRSGTIPRPAPTGAPSPLLDATVNDEALARAVDQEEHHAAASVYGRPPPRHPSVKQPSYDPARLTYQPRVRKAPGARGPPPPLPPSHPSRAYEPYQSSRPARPAPGSAGYQYGQVHSAEPGSGGYYEQTPSQRAGRQDYGGEQDQGPDWAEEIDKFADNASRVAEAGLARAASTFSTLKARAQALVDQGKDQHNSSNAGMPNWLPRRDGNKTAPSPSVSTRSAESSEAASSDNKSENFLRHAVPRRQFPDSSDADAHPVGERDLAALSQASSATSVDNTSPSTKKEDPRAALARLAESTPPVQMQSLDRGRDRDSEPTKASSSPVEQGAQEKGSSVPASDSTQAASPNAKESTNPKTATLAAAGTGLGAGLVGSAALTGLDDDEKDDDDSDDLEYVANPFEDEE